MNITAQQILESIPSRFRAEKAKNYTANFQFVITGEEELQYTVNINNEKCELATGLQGTPDCTVKAKASVYIDLETGKANPQMALMLGKVKVSNVAAMIQFAKCFRKFSVETTPTTANTFQKKTKNIAPKTGPLAGVKIIDFTRLLPGPLATMFLADMGADVLKIEDPDNPDYIRSFEPKVNGESLYYLALNRNKRSVAVNALSEKGKEIIYDLVKSADVLIEQYRPGVMKSMGFGYEELAAHNPKLIYISITGYGQQSSKAMLAGHDLNYVALSGALGTTGTEQRISIPGFQLADIAGGGYMAMTAVTAALYQRERTGKGEWIDVAMTDAAVPFSVLQVAAHQSTQQNIPPGNFELSGGLPNYNVYCCKDGKHIALGSLEPKFWNLFCKKVNRPDWAEKYLTKGKELQQLKTEVSNLFMAKDSTEWVEEFKQEDFCFTPVNNIGDLFNDNYLKERKIFVENEHPAVGKYLSINQPLKFLESNFANNKAAPMLGEDTLSVLAELNYSKEQIDELLRKNVIK